MCCGHLYTCHMQLAQQGAVGTELPASLQGCCILAPADHAVACAATRIGSAGV